MSKVTIAGDVNGTGVFTIAAPNGNTNRTLTLPDEAGTVLTSVSGLLAGNLTGSLPAIDGSALTGIAGGVTSLNGQTGAITNTSLYAIGSYVMGRVLSPSTNYAANATLAGSSLYNIGSITLRDYTPQWYTINSGVTNSPASPTTVGSGTWRCTTPTHGYSGSYPGAGGGLWVRIS
jgi:hypothetical protein